jgi:predicted deacylase
MLDIIEKIFHEKIQKANELRRPRVLVNICSHGDEIIGLDVQEKCIDLTIKKGSLIFNIGNPEALRLGKRFVESDLNRSFPGSENGTYEEQIAFYMMKYISLFDYVVDIHSTVSGIDNCIIIEDNSPETNRLISACHNCDTILLMTATKGSSIFTACRQEDNIIPAVTFEYGNNSIETTNRTYDDLLSVLAEIGVVDQPNNLSVIKTPSKFECYATFSKSIDDILEKNIENFKLVKNGDVVGHTIQGLPITAPTDFYPVLFGKNSYTTIFGFMAKKI